MKRRRLTSLLLSSLITVSMSCSPVAGMSVFAAEEAAETAATVAAVEEEPVEELQEEETIEEEHVEKEAEESEEIGKASETEEGEIIEEELEEEKSASTEDSGETAEEITDNASEDEADNYVDEEIMTEDAQDPAKAEDNGGEEYVAQAIWTEDNTTLTFYYGSPFSVGELYNGAKITNIWSGTDITDTGSNAPAWNTAVRNKLTKVIFDSSFADVRPTSTNSWFYGCEKMSYIDFENLNTSSVKDMSYMFQFCESLTSLDASRFDTTNVEKMTHFVYSCDNLTDLVVNGIDTSNVISMEGAFAWNIKLSSIDLSGIDTSNVISMEEMFYNCKSLTDVNLNGFNTTSVTDMTKMFCGCSSLVSVDVSGFDTSYVEYMWYMFSDCSSLDSIDVSSFDTSNVKEMSGMFSDCSSLDSIDVSGFDTSNVESMHDMFSGCSSLASVDVSGFDTCKVDNMSGMFSGCSGLVSVDVSGFDMSNVTDTSKMFYGCSGITTLDFSNAYCSADDFGSSWDSMFAECTNLIILNLGTFSLHKVEGTYGYIKTSSAENMFKNCTKLETIYFSKDSIEWPTPNIISTNMFYGCNSLVGKDSNSTVTFDADKIDISMAKTANKGGYFSVKGYFEDPQQGIHNLVDKHIKALVPQNGDQNVDHALDYYSIQFDENIVYAKPGYAYLYDTSDESNPVAKAFIGDTEDINTESQCMITGMNTLELRFPISVELGHEYYIKIDPDCIKKDTTDIGGVDSPEEVYFKGITDNQSWRFKICDVDYMHFSNPTDKIHESVYHIIFTPIKASMIQMIDDGSGGTCFGWAYAVGAKANGYDGVNGFGKDLMSLKKSSTFGATDFSFLEYIQYAHLYQYNFEKTKEKNRTKNKYNDIYDAIKASINGKGPKIIIGIYGKGGHAVYPLSILKENDSEIQIRVVNPNEDFVTGSHFSTLTLKKRNGVINGFKMEDYDKDISYSIIDDAIDTAFSMVSVYMSETNMVHSSQPINDDAYYELEPCGDNEANAQTDHLYWHDGTQINTFLGSNDQIGITDGYKEVSVKAGNDANITLDLDEMTATVNSSSEVSSGYEINYKEATSADDIKTTTVSSSTTGEISSQMTSEGIVIQAPESEDITVHTADQSILANTEGDTVLIKTDDESGIEVFKDSNGNGEYDEQVEVEILKGDGIQLLESMVLGVQDKTYTGSPITQKLTLKDGDTVLTQDTDYTVSYDNNINAGTAKVIITGMGKYTGTIEKTFEITPKAVTPTITLSKTSFIYNGKAQKPGVTVNDEDVTLVNGTDYTATYRNNTNAGTASVVIKCKGNYTGTATKNFSIAKKTISALKISGITNKTYNKKAQTQAVVVKNGTVTLKNGTDYSLSYKNNTNAGTASVVITGKDNYTGTVTKTFTINKAANAITAGNFTKAYSTKAQSFSLGAKATGGTLTYASNNKSVTVDNAGKVTVKAKFIGKAAITITAQNANYNQAIKRITITVNPNKTALSSAKNSASKKMTVKWKKNAAGSGYQIQYSTAKNFKGAKTVTIKKNKIVTKTIGGLKKGKKYYVRVRTYKAVGKLKFYSGWSTVKKVAIKK